MIISWNTTNACNMFCDHCYRDAGCKADEELNTQEAKTLLEQIAKAGFKIMIFWWRATYAPRYRRTCRIRY